MIFVDFGKVLNDLITEKLPPHHQQQIQRTVDIFHTRRKSDQCLLQFPRNKESNESYQKNENIVTWWHCESEVFSRQHRIIFRIHRSLSLENWKIECSLSRDGDTVHLSLDLGHFHARPSMSGDGWSWVTLSHPWRKYLERFGQNY